MTTSATRACIAIAAAFATLTLANAQPDPMKPLAAPAAGSAASAAAATTAATSFAAAPSSAAPALTADRLVAIRRNSDGRLQALIGEQWIGVGERVGGRAGNATLKALDDSSATLVLDRQQLVLRVLADRAAPANPCRDCPCGDQGHPPK